MFSVCCKFSAGHVPSRDFLFHWNVRLSDAGLGLVRDRDDTETSLVILKSTTSWC